MKTKKYRDCGYAEKDYLLDEQRYECAICKREISWKSARFSHCRKTKYVRGLLCRSCCQKIGRPSSDPAFSLRRDKFLEHGRKRYEHFWEGGEYIPIWPIYCGDYGEEDFAPKWLEADRLALNWYSMFCYTEGYVDVEKAIAMSERGETCTS